MSYTEIPLSGGIRVYIECTWSLKIDRPSTIFPDGCTDLLFSESGEVYVSGVTSKAYLLDDHRFGTQLFGLRLSAGVVPFLLGIPSSLLLDQVVQLTELDSRIARSLAVKLKEADTLNELKCRAVETVESICRRTSPDRRLLFALSRLDSQPVRSVASSLGISERHLHRLFLQGVGLGPARVKRIRRMQRAIDAMRKRDGTVSMVDIALAHGFYDQAHLSRELKELTGLSPVALHRSLIDG